jgi:hypothetical protein
VPRPRRWTPPRSRRSGRRSGSCSRACAEGRGDRDESWTLT